MGYYTFYTLEIEKPTKGQFTQEEIDKVVAKLDELFPIWWDLDEDDKKRQWSDYFTMETKVGDRAIQFSGKDMYKWYSSRGNITEFATHYPEYIITFGGDGEDGEDLWKNYYYQGGVICDELQWVYGMPPPHWYKAS